MTRRYTTLMLIVALALSGCAKPDWIEQTLVTADVTGKWLGSCQARSGSVPTIEMTLRQSGPKVTGVGRSSPGGISWTLDGTINGDIFTFSGIRSGMVGEFKVNGDEMTGPVSGGGNINCHLNRQSSSDSPRSQP